MTKVFLLLTQHTRQSCIHLKFKNRDLTITQHDSELTRKYLTRQKMCCSSLWRPEVSEPGSDHNKAQKTRVRRRPPSIVPPCKHAQMSDIERFRYFNLRVTQLSPLRISWFGASVLESGINVGDGSVSTCTLVAGACGSDIEEALGLPQLGSTLRVIHRGCGGLCIGA